MRGALLGDGAGGGSPLGALRLLGASRTSLGAAVTFLAFWAGLNGLQINLFNYAQHKFGWSKVDGTVLQVKECVGIFFFNRRGRVSHTPLHMASTRNVFISPPGGGAFNIRCGARQATSGLLLACSNAAGPAFLLPRVGARGTVRLGMAAMAASLAAAGVARSARGFRLAVCGASLATVALPVLMATVAGSFGLGQGGASLAALEAANTLNRVVAYTGMSRLLGWSIAEGRALERAGDFFLVGATLVAAGLAVYEAAVVPELRRQDAAAAAAK